MPVDSRSKWSVSPNHFYRLCIRYACCEHVLNVTNFEEFEVYLQQWLRSFNILNKYSLKYLSLLQSKFNFCRGFLSHSSSEASRHSQQRREVQTWWSLLFQKNTERTFGEVRNATEPTFGEVRNSTIANNRKQSVGPAREARESEGLLLGVLASVFDPSIEECAHILCGFAYIGLCGSIN